MDIKGIQPAQMAVFKVSHGEGGIKTLTGNREGFPPCRI